MKCIHCGKKDQPTKESICNNCTIKMNVPINKTLWVIIFMCFFLFFYWLWNELITLTIGTIIGIAIGMIIYKVQNND